MILSNNTPPPTYDDHDTSYRSGMSSLSSISRHINTVTNDTSQHADDQLSLDDDNQPTTPPPMVMLDGNNNNISTVPTTHNNNQLESSSSLLPTRRPSLEGISTNNTPLLTSSTMPHSSSNISNMSIEGQDGGAGLIATSSHHNMRNNNNNNPPGIKSHNNDDDNDNIMPTNTTAATDNLNNNMPGQSSSSLLQRKFPPRGPAAATISKHTQSLLTLDMRNYRKLEDAIMQVKLYLENIRQLAEKLGGGKVNSESNVEGMIVLNENEIDMGVQLVMDKDRGGGEGGRLKKSLFVTIITGERGSGLILRTLLQKIFHNRSIKFIDDDGKFPPVFLVDALSEVRDDLEHHDYTANRRTAAATACQMEATHSNNMVPLRPSNQGGVSGAINRQGQAVLPSLPPNNTSGTSGGMQQATTPSLYPAPPASLPPTMSTDSPVAISQPMQEAMLFSSTRDETNAVATSNPRPHSCESTKLEAVKSTPSELNNYPHNDDDMLQTQMMRHSSLGTSLSSNSIFNHHRKLPAMDNNVPPAGVSISGVTSLSELESSRSIGKRRQRWSTPGGICEGSVASLLPYDLTSHQRGTTNSGIPQGTSAHFDQTPPQLSQAHHPIAGHSTQRVMPMSPEYPLRASSEDAALQSRMLAAQHHQYSMMSNQYGFLPPQSNAVSHFNNPAESATENISSRCRMESTTPPVDRMLHRHHNHHPNSNGRFVPVPIDPEQDIIRRAITESQAAHIAHTRQQVADDIQFRRALEAAAQQSQQQQRPSISAEQDTEEQEVILMARRRSILDEEQRRLVEIQQYEAEVQRAIDESHHVQEEEERRKESESELIQEVMARSEIEASKIPEDTEEEKELLRQAISTSMANTDVVDEKDLLEEAVRKSLSEKVNENDLIAEATRVSLTDSNSSNDDPEEEEILEEALRLSLEEKERAESEENELIRRALEASMMIS